MVLTQPPPDFFAPYPAMIVLKNYSYKNVLESLIKIMLLFFLYNNDANKKLCIFCSAQINFTDFLSGSP